jgi:hypothetical protein
MSSPPDIEEDGRAWWLGPVDVVADPTGRDPSISIAARDDLTPQDARRLAEYLTAAADYCDEADRG